MVFGHSRDTESIQCVHARAHYRDPLKYERLYRLQDVFLAVAMNLSPFIIPQYNNLGIYITTPTLFVTFVFFIFRRFSIPSLSPFPIQENPSGSAVNVYTTRTMSEDVNERLFLPVWRTKSK